jgi:hypothetical protein
VQWGLGQQLGRGQAHGLYTMRSAAGVAVILHACLTCSLRTMSLHAPSSGASAPGCAGVDTYAGG